MKFRDAVDVLEYKPQDVVRDGLPKSQTGRKRSSPIRRVNVEKKVLSHRGRAGSQAETRTAVGRAALMEKAANGELELPKIEVKLCDGEWPWLIETIEHEDVGYHEVDGTKER